MVLFGKNVAPAVVGSIGRANIGWYVTRCNPNIVPQSKLTELFRSNVVSEMVLIEGSVF